MTEKTKLLIFLSQFELSIKKQEDILNSLEDFSVENMLSQCHAILSADEIQKMAKEYDRLKLESSIDNMQRNGIKFLTAFDEEYPKSLSDLPDRPLLLYAKGDLSLMQKPCLAVVGTRSPSNYGKVITEKFVDTLAREGFVIVSGLGYGIDSIAHRKALEVGGKTIAVIGSGFSNIYPALHANLAEEIAQKGLLLSEYPPSERAKKYTFPRRNRIVAGLSQGTLIPEAGKKSGTIYTKDFALDYGRDVFAVPGSILNEKSELPNHIIQTAQAECVLCPEDILQFYGLEKHSQEKVIQTSFEEQTILNLLSKGEKDFDFLAENSKIPVNILSSCLTTMEIRGLIKRLPGKMFSLA